MAPSPAGPPSTLFATLRPGAAQAVLAALACALASCGDGAAPRVGAVRHTKEYQAFYGPRGDPHVYCSGPCGTVVCCVFTPLALNT